MLVEERLEGRVARSRRKLQHLDADSLDRHAAARERHLEAAGDERACQRRRAPQVADAEQMLDIEEDLHRTFRSWMLGTPWESSRKK